MKKSITFETATLIMDIIVQIKKANGGFYELNGIEGVEK